MTDTAEPKKPITAKQAEARRENGAKSRGPKTPEGKATSSANSLQHGMFASTRRHITRGPLAEDPEEVDAFIDSVAMSFYGGDNPALCAAAEEVGRLMWNLRRSHAWCSDAATRSSTAHTEVDDLERVRWQVKFTHASIDVVRRISSSQPTVDELVMVAIRLPFSDFPHIPARVDPSQYFREIGREKAHAVVQAMVEDMGEDEAVSAITEAGAHHAREFEVRGEWVRQLVAHRMATDPALEAGRRGQAHASRELNQAIRRFRELEGLLPDDDLS